MSLANLTIKPSWHKRENETAQPSSVRPAPGESEIQSDSAERIAKNPIAAGLEKLKRHKREYKAPQSELSKFFFGPREKPPLKQRLKKKFLVILVRLTLCLLMIALANAIMGNT